jgi:hypothetical protein
MVRKAGCRHIDAEDICVVALIVISRAVSHGPRAPPMLARAALPAAKVRSSSAGSIVRAAIPPAPAGAIGAGMSVRDAWPAEATSGVLRRDP